MIHSQWFRWDGDIAGGEEFESMVESLECTESVDERESLKVEIGEPRGGGRRGEQRKPAVRGKEGLDGRG